MTETRKVQGVLTQWNRGFGSVIGQDGKKYFLFHSNVENPERLRIGDIVEFIPAPAADIRHALTDALCAERTGERVETVRRSGGTGFGREEIISASLDKFLHGSDDQ